MAHKLNNADLNNIPNKKPWIENLNEARKEKSVLEEIRDQEAKAASLRHNRVANAVYNTLTWVIISLGGLSVILLAVRVLHLRFKLKMARFRTNQ